MEILYDYQILTMQKYGGISRYFYELIKNISTYNNVNIDIPVILSQNYYFENYLDKKCVNKYLPKTSKIVRSINQINTINNLKHVKYDIVHPTYYNTYLLKNINGKLVVTIYDMIHEIYPEIFLKSDKTSLYKKEMIFKADKIISISENTKKDILRFYPSIDEKKIEVIYLANSIIEKPNVFIKLDLPEKYIFFVGNRQFYKNFKNFLKAINIVFKKHKDIHLVCAGGGKFNFKEMSKMTDLKIDNRIHQYNFTDDELNIVYKNAICFVFPSKYEGFGIPVLEAFANKCPTILSESSSLPEIGGKASLYIEPNTPKDIAEKILYLIDNTNKREELINLGLEQLKNFSWENTAKNTLNLYKKLL